MAVTLMICPGIHDPVLSDRFCQALHHQFNQSSPPAPLDHRHAWAVLPTQQYAPFNGFAVGSYWQEVADPQQPLLVVAFSAGGVGAIAAAQLWQSQGGAIAAFVAVDGWGVPQIGPFPFYRVSHDYFTHWSSALLGTGQEAFYADPPVEHLALWHYPEQARGVWTVGPDSSGAVPKRVTAIEFIAAILVRHGWN
jgi:hypothetical protein